MNNFNSAFFSLYETVFITYSEAHGKAQALNFMKKLFETSLSKAYLEMGFTKGNAKDFARVVQERDEGVGLFVKFPLVTETKIIYQFHRDPFPNLKGLLASIELDACYLDFKVNFILGEKWKWQSTKHLWEGYPYSEHIITKDL